MKKQAKKENNNGWNYRVIKMPDKKLKNLPQSYSFGIYEVYYTNDKPTSWSAEPMWPIGETFNDLVEDFGHMQNAFSAKCLELKDGILVEGNRFGRNM